jgi:hypothetical protein
MPGKQNHASLKRQSKRPTSKNLNSKPSPVNVGDALSLKHIPNGEWPIKDITALEWMPKQQSGFLSILESEELTAFLKSARKEELTAFFKSARKVWRQAHPPTERNKGGRPSKESIIIAACQRVWDKPRKRGLTLGQLLKDVATELKTQGHRASKNTVYKHLWQWMRVNLTPQQVPIGMLQKKPLFRKWALLLTTLHAHKDEILKAIETQAIPKSSSRSSVIFQN